MDEPTPKTKVCTKCAEIKPTSDFHRNSAAKDGLNYRCKACTNAQRRAHYDANRDRELERGRAWRVENPERQRELSKAWEEANPERAREARREWRAQNRERHLASRANWLAQNPDYYARWNDANRDKLRESGRRYKAANAEKNAEASRKRRARERLVEIGPVDLAALWTGWCGICGSSIDRALAWPDPMSKSVDHIIPLAHGGTHEQSNLQYAHLRCNVAKGARLPDTA